MASNVGVFRVERSTSLSEKHLLYSTVFIYKKDVGLIPYTKCLYLEQVVKPTYSKGEAKVVSVKLNPGDFVIHVRLVKNFLKRVIGYISIYNYSGELLYRAKYVNGFVARSKGNPVYAWLVRLLLEYSKIPVTGMKLGDEK